MANLVRFGVICVVVALLAVALIPQDAAVDTMRLFVLVVTFLIAFTLLVDVLAWRSASRAIEVLDRKLDTIKNANEDELRNSFLGDLQVILAEYAVATSKIAPIPDSIYEKHRDRLNRAWAERESEVRNPLI
jgi:phosphoglycerol transferase MdoB-like AlkP superfamily enzyme